jgi:hypothetical protein
LRGLDCLNFCVPRLHLRRTLDNHTTMDTLSQGGAGRNSEHDTKAYTAGSSSRRGAAQLLVRFSLSADPIGKVREATGRFAWTLLQLHRAGDAGITSLTNPAPRLSHYVHVLRREGVGISTTPEEHGGAFAGRHGRYRLTTPIEVVEIREPMGAQL